MSLLLPSGPAPANTVLPVITGEALVGHVLVTTTGTWSNSPTGYSYQWFRAVTDRSGTVLYDDGEPLGETITGATARAYTVTLADHGRFLFVEVTAFNTGGSAYVDVLFPDLVDIDSDGGFARKKKKKRDKKYKALIELDEIRAELAALDRLRKLRAEAQKKSTEIKRKDDEEAILALMDY